MRPGTTTCLGLLVFTASGAGLGCTTGSGAAIRDGGVVGHGGSGSGSHAGNGAAGHSVVDVASEPAQANGGSGGAGSRDADARDTGFKDADSSDAASAPADASPAAVVTVTLSETVEAFRNPMEGFRPSRYIGDAAFRDYEYTSTYKHYVPYAALESSATDAAQKPGWSRATSGAPRW
jgi:hypothetical protein